jgi:molecular chaperone DnaK (HSP70)
MDEIPIKYEWLVTMEIAELPFLVLADTAEEAMKIAEDVHQLKNMDLDRLPELICTSAQIHDVTNEYRERLKILTTVKDRETRDNFKGFLQENPTWSKNKRIDDDVERRYKENENKAYEEWYKEKK